jgi:BirA family biotin operon repressor/biotin-[acetyl-CoA-carboxylase] ligase
MITAHDGWQIEWHEVLDSTMTTATELAVAGAPGNLVVVADYQSSGRGTNGRVWTADPGTCLMFTVLSRADIPATELAALPLLVAERVARTLRERLCLLSQVDPPNDVVVAGRKLCGVLCTSRTTGVKTDWVLCGVGLNTFMRPDQLPTPTATSLLVEGAAIPSHRELLNWLLDELSFLRTEETTIPL